MIPISRLRHHFPSKLIQADQRKLNLISFPQSKHLRLLQVKIGHDGWIKENSLKLRCFKKQKYSGSKNINAKRAEVNTIQFHF